MGRGELSGGREKLKTGLSTRTYIKRAGRVPGAALLVPCGVGLPGVVSDGSRRLGQVPAEPTGIDGHPGGPERHLRLRDVQL